MSFESPRSSVFTFQSSVHSSHVLCSLNEQRKRDVLCDVTVVVENKGFRAHRSVLASCSEYFHTRVTSLVGQGLVITLPDEVTVEGFDPLLQFAYSAKLPFTKENILEIRRCASILGFHNLDKACFDFLIPKFFDSSRSSQPAPRKVCCRKKFWPEKSEKASSGADVEKEEEEEEEEEREVKEESGDTESLLGIHGPMTAGSCAKPAGDTPGSLGVSCPGISMPMDSALLCLKYRKFQNACGKERLSSLQVPSSSSSSSSSLAPATKGQVSHHGEEGGGSVGNISGGCKCEADKASVNEAAVMAVCRPPALAPLPGNPGSSGVGFREVLEPGCSPSVGSAGAEPDCCTLGPCGSCFPPCAAGGEEEEEEQEGVGNHQNPADSHPAHPELSSAPGQKEGGERSTIEREVAEHLAKGFWSTYLDPSKECPMGASAGYRWCKRLDLTPGGASDCPFLRDQGLSQAETRPYDSSLNSGDDSDTEGASESSSTQRVPEVLLPFPVEQIVSLTRNDFQNILKQHQLTREQLDFVHDVRRRSKNCIAARRCRKRKLECINDLECEIEKLHCEKQMLVEEKTRLTQEKLRTLQHISGLCQMFSKAALQPEHLQVLAKYSSPDCPLSTLLTPQIPPPSPDCPLSTLLTPQIPPPSPDCPLSTLLTPQIPPTSASACPPVDPSPGETHRDPRVPFPLEPVPAANHDRTQFGSAPSGRGLSTITDVCLDMSHKCTRDECRRPNSINK